MEPQTDLALLINQYIDHTLLKPEATPADIDRLCAEAQQYQFAAVCVNSHYVKRCAENLIGTRVAIASTVGFPLGATSTAIKVAETEWAVRNGASEIDMVINVGELKAGNSAFVEDDILAVVETAHSLGAIVKVILETGLLTDDEKICACKAAKAAGADFVKTSTGFGHGGATVEDVRLMKAAVDGTLGVKAAGGIRTWEIAKAMIAAGATRLGASAGVAIVNEAREEKV